MKKMKSHARDMCILMYLNFMSKKICKQTLNLVGMISTVLVMNSEALFFILRLRKCINILWIMEARFTITHKESYTQRKPED